MKEWIARVDDIPVGGLRRVHVFGVAVCLAQPEAGVFCAVQDTCTHERESISEGALMGFQVECPGHFSLFDVRDGSVKGGVAQEPLEVYPVVVEGGDVYFSGGDQ